MVSSDLQQHYSALNSSSSFCLSCVFLPSFPLTSLPPHIPASLCVVCYLTIFSSQRPGMASIFCSGPSSEPHSQSAGCKEGGSSCFLSQPLSLIFCGSHNFSVPPTASTLPPLYFRQGAVGLAHKIWIFIA